MSRSESPEAPAITVSGRPAMRRDSERRRGGTRRTGAWAAAAALLGFGDGVDWRRKRRAGAVGTAAAIGEEGGGRSGCRWSPVSCGWTGGPGAWLRDIDMFIGGSRLWLTCEPDYLSERNCARGAYIV
jgi:hypothetical protein